MARKNALGTILKDLAGGMLYTLYVKNGEVFVDDSTNPSEPIPGEGLVDGGTFAAHKSSTTDHPEATTSAAGMMSPAQVTKLNGIAAGANNYTHPANHPASVITQDASNRFVTDTEKATWNAKQAALGFTPENSANKGVANGYPSLDATGKIPAGQLPSYVDDIIEGYFYTNKFYVESAHTTEITGEAGKVYVDITTSSAPRQYRWSGSAYVEIIASPGSTDAVTEGSTNKYFTEARVRATVLTGLSTATNAVIAATDSVLAAFGKLQAQMSDLLTSFNAHKGAGGAAHAAATTSVAGFLSAADKTKLDGIAAGANNYVHPTTDGNIHVPAGGAANQILKYSAAGTAAWTALDDTLHGTRGGGTQHAAATTSVAGFMSAADKAKLDSLVAPANTFMIISAQNNTVFPSGTFTYAALLALFPTGVNQIKIAVTTSSDTTITGVAHASLYVHWQIKGIGLEVYVSEAQIYGLDRDADDKVFLYPIATGMTAS